MATRGAAPGRRRFKIAALAVVGGVRWAACAARGRKVKLLMQEIASTEETYLAGLETLLNVYLVPISTALASGKPSSAIAGLINETMVGLEAILTVNRTFLNEMKQRVASSTSLCSRLDAVGETMRRFASAWKLYRSYHSLFDQVQSQLDSIDHPTVKSLLASSPDRPSLTNLLILPVQRLPRYELFLDGLVRTEANANVEEALRSLRETVHWLDDRLKAAAPSHPRSQSVPVNVVGSLKKNEAKRGSAPTIKLIPNSHSGSLSTALTSSSTTPKRTTTGPGSLIGRVQSAASREQRLANIEANLHNSASAVSPDKDSTPTRRRSRSADIIVVTDSTRTLSPPAPARAPPPVSKEAFDAVKEENLKLQAQVRELKAELERAQERVEKLESYRRKYKARKKEAKLRNKSVVTISATSGVTRGLSSNNLQRRRPSATLA